MTPAFLTTAQNRRIAYHQTPGQDAGAQGPGVVFLGGFRSDMNGSKALHLQDWAQSTGRAFLRFDYSGHGQSSGDFLDGSIGNWVQDAQTVIETLTTGPQILIGSSMGGWIALLLARAIPHRVHALIGIAAAPDFTEDSMWANFTPVQRDDLASGQIDLPSDYGPYTITQNLITDGRKNLVLRSPLNLPFPTRLLQGTADTDVPPAVALRLMDHATCVDLRLTLVKGADHRFSTPECLDLITAALTDLHPND
ncbi:Serine aminopeptidase, S33 [Pseudorhodobacter antarcticus]|uniref:Serine aminopeptidase, S33 n=1 Tax=Pseudorhodobacter antarcticus TaxID=1077947 RepID=A0A1H8I8R7_9RHOB|nr:alpha/beta hydrolase [Pseudorhodobacter antarcticus]SEN65113.1 Serine aminopeptidase, S33 [Pseudorhodobacter antarcticus]